MNFKTAAFFILLSIGAFPAITHARANQSNRAASPVKHVSAGLFDRILSLGHKTQPAVTDAHGNRKAVAAKPR